MQCKRCLVDGVEPDENNPHLCRTCVKAENNRIAHYRQHNYNWVEVAKEADLEVWERQPGETDLEYTVWMHYRDAYPGKRPSYKDAAIGSNTSIHVVRKIGQRWDFPMRLQAWAKHVDEITLAQRHQEILDMNKAHIDMATKMRDKLATAIERIDPYSLSPKEIVAMMKLSTELERRARLDTTPLGPTPFVDDNPELKKIDVQSGSMTEIISILAKAGQLNNVGVRQTVTTEVVVKGDE